MITRNASNLLNCKPMAEQKVVRLTALMRKANAWPSGFRVREPNRTA